MEDSKIPMMETNNKAQSLDDDNYDTNFEIYREDIKEINRVQKPLNIENENTTKISGFMEENKQQINNIEINDKENNLQKQQNSDYKEKIVNKFDQLEKISKKLKLKQDNSTIKKSQEEDKEDNNEHLQQGQRKPLQELVESSDKKELINKSDDNVQKYKKQQQQSDFGEFMKQCKKKIPRIQRDKIQFQLEQEKLKEEKLKKESQIKDIEDKVVVTQDQSIF